MKRFKIYIKIFPVKDLSLIIIDSNVSKKIVTTIDQENIDNICILPSTGQSTDNFSHFKSSLSHKVNKMIIKERTLFQESDFKQIRKTANEIMTLCKDGNCLFISNDKNHVGLVLLYIFALSDENFKDALERVRKIHPSLTPQKENFEEIKGFYEYLKKHEITKKKVHIEEKFRSDTFDIETEEHKILFFGLIKFLTKIFSSYSIDKKLIFMISFLIVASTSVMIFLASYFFKEDSSIRIKENNLNYARVIGLKVESDFDSLVEKTRLMADLMIGEGKNQNGRPGKRNAVKSISNKKILFLGIAERKGNSIQFIKKIYNHSLIDENGLEVKIFEKLSQLKNSQIAKSFNGAYGLLNISHGMQIPVTALYFPFDDTKSNLKIVVCYFKADDMLQIFQTSGVLKSFMVNETGDVLAHTDNNLVIASVNVSDSAIVKEMLTSKLNNGQKRYRDKEGEYYLGSFRKLDKYGLGIIVAARENQVFQAVYTIQKRNITILLIVLCVSILMAFFFSKTLSIPILKLVNETYKFQEKNLILKEIKGNDEVEFLTTSFHAMVDAILDSQRQLQEYADNLELMVEERTRELKEARDELWGEMKLANKIQTVLLPENPQIDGFEIKGFMMPADEVGGDYFDVINAEGRDWFVIGDVSGHGVPAGLVMMMVQTSVRTVLSHMPDIPPSELLAVVNRVISYNIKRLGEKKYMTVTIFACLENGKLYHSGLHIDLLLFRSVANEVEWVETGGMWLGIMDEIADYVEDAPLEMKPQDVLLMYTDGITEAPDIKGELFSTERLADILKNNGRNSLDDIKESILSELEDYKKDDDVTMLMLRKL